MRSSASSGVKRNLNVSVAGGGPAFADAFAGAATAAGFLTAGAAVAGAAGADAPPPPASPAGFFEAASFAASFGGSLAGVGGGASSEGGSSSDLGFVGTAFFFLVALPLEELPLEEQAPYLQPCT